RSDNRFCLRAGADAQGRPTPDARIQGASLLVPRVDHAVRRRHLPRLRRQEGRGREIPARLPRRPRLQRRRGRAMTQPNLKVKIAGIEFANPIMTASGTFGYGEEFNEYIDLSRLGGIVTKSITRHER